jgi:hypothetical protein
MVFDISKEHSTVIFRDESPRRIFLDLCEMQNSNMKTIFSIGTSGSTQP